MTPLSILPSNPSPVFPVVTVCTAMSSFFHVTVSLTWTERSDGDNENGMFWFEAPRGIVTGMSAKEAENVTHVMSGKMSNSQDLAEFNATYVNFFYFRLAYDSY